MKYIALKDGMRIAYQEWGHVNAVNKTAKKIIAVHGWLDNSNSFKILGPKLASIGYHCIAIDQIGHGKSSRVGSEAHYSQPTVVAYLNEVVDSLGWDKPDIVGHSMGAGVSLLFAGVFPEKLNKLVLIEGFGPVTADASKCAKNLRRSLEAEHKYRLKASAVPDGDTSKIYPTLADAVQARIKSLASYPGTQTLSQEAALDLVARGTYRVDAVTGAPLNISKEDVDRDCVLGDGAVRFRHDPRMVLQTRVYLTNEQVTSFVHGVTAKTLLITAENGWPMGDNAAVFEDRVKYMTDKGVLTHITMPGSHHLHMDPATEPAVSQQIIDFLQTE